MSKKSKSYEPKKTINVSLQSKKYFKTINDILKEWDDNDLQASTEVCESIILSNKFKKSITLLGILNAYKMAENMLELYSIGKNDENLEDKLEAVLSSAINIDVNKLMDAVKEQSYNSISNKEINKVEVIKEIPLENNKEDNKEDVELQIAKNKMLSNDSLTKPSNDKVLEGIKGEISITKNENIVDIEVVNEDEDKDDKYNISTDFLFNL